MLFGLGPTELAFLALVALAAGCVLLAFTLPLASASGAEARIRGLAKSRNGNEASSQRGAGRLIDGQGDNRRRQLQDSLKQLDARAQQRKGGTSLRTQISRAGLSVPVPKFWFISIALGGFLVMLSLLLGLPIYVAALIGVAGTFGMPRWFLSTLQKRRQKAFLEELADAIDVMVRGLKAGLPLSDAMRVIASESGPPLGPEFMEVVEGQRVGITIDQGLERMFERMPLPEVSFLGIVISIQSKSGGNLSEALANLSRVLRERKKLKGKVRAMSQEAKSSAAIIGALPFLIVAALFFISPQYLQPLIATTAGHMILAGAGAWMLAGILVMRSMINFDI